MVSCNSHLKNVLDTNEQVPQIFQGMTTGQLCFLFCASKPKFEVGLVYYIEYFARLKKFFRIVKSVLIMY